MIHDQLNPKGSWFKSVGGDFLLLSSDNKTEIFIKTLINIEGMIRPELADLEVILDREIDKAKKERIEMGLSLPPAFKRSIHYYFQQGAYAQALYTDSGPKIGVNVLTSCRDHLPKEDKYKVDTIMEYFDIARDMLSTHENNILWLIESPDVALEAFEKEFPSLEAFAEFKAFYKERGRSYEESKAFLMGEAPLIKILLGEMLPKLKDAFEGANIISSLRHELDHCDFFSSPIITEYAKVKEHADNLSYKFKVEKDISVAKEYAAAKMRLLDVSLKADTLLETRALFFNYVKQGEWETADIKDVKEQVYHHFDIVYIQKMFPENILDKFASKSWSEGEMDRQTSNYLLYTVNKEAGSPNIWRYSFEESLVNKPVAEKILAEIKRIQKTLRQYAKTAIDAVGDAYKNNPSKLAEANKAKTFEEYIAICRS